MYTTRLRTISALAELEQLRPQWDPLWETSAARVPALSWAWTAAWWKHLRKRQPLAVAEVTQNGTLVGLVPLTIVSQRPFAVCRVAQAGAGVFDYGDFLSTADHEPAVAMALARFFVDKLSWDVLELSRLSWQTDFLSNFCAQFPAERFHVASGAGAQSWTTALDEDWDQLMLKFSPRWRKAVRSIARKIESQTPTFALAQSEAECMAMLRTLFALRAGPDADRAESETTGDNPYLRFHGEVVTALFKSGIVRFYSLAFEGKPAAIVYGYCYADRFLYYLPGYDKTYKEISPGTALTTHILQEALHNGIRVFDFGIGDEDYKHHWNATPTPTQHVTITAVSAATRVRSFNERTLAKLSRTLTQTAAHAQSSTPGRVLPGKS